MTVDKTQYLSAAKIADYMASLPAVVIDWTAHKLSEDHEAFNKAIPADQFEVEVYIYCVKSDDEADYQWWDEKFSELAEAEDLDCSNVQFIIYPDDENDPR